MNAILLRVIISTFLFLPLLSYGVETTINYVWGPVSSLNLTPLTLVTSQGQLSGEVTLPARQGTSGWNNKLYDCNVKEWSGLWSDQIYTYAAVPMTYSTSIGTILLSTNFTNSSYQWSEDGKRISYWMMTSETDVTRGPKDCAAPGQMGVMGYKIGGARIKITVPTLPWAGQLQINIPIYIANMEHWWNSTRGGSSQWAYGYTDFKHLLDVAWYIPVTVKSYANCSLSSASMTINHGTVNSNIASAGISASKSIVVHCSTPTNMKVKILNSHYIEGNVIPCGKGTCTLTVNGTASTQLHNVISQNITVNSLLVAATDQLGAFSGSAILRVDVD